MTIKNLCGVLFAGLVTPNSRRYSPASMVGLCVNTSARKLLADGVPPKDVAKNLGVSIPMRYRCAPASTHA